MNGKKYWETRRRERRMRRQLVSSSRGKLTGTQFSAIARTSLIAWIAWHGTVGTVCSLFVPFLLYIRRILRAIYTLHIYSSSSSGRSCAPWWWIHSIRMLARNLCVHSSRRVSYAPQQRTNEQTKSENEINEMQREQNRAYCKSGTSE